MISLVEGDVTTVTVQAILFGIYLASLAHCLRWLILDDEGWRFRKKINWAMLAVAVVLFIFSTIDFSISFHLMISAIRGDVRYFEDPWVVNTVLEISTMLITDAVLIYRCWVVYAKSWRSVCLPILFWILFFTSSILCVYYYTILVYTRSTETAFSASILLYRFWILVYCTNIATNIYATSAIVLRILNVAKASGNSGGSKRLHNVSRIIAESGILYTSTSILSMIASITVSHVDLRLFSDVATVFTFSAAGITFNLILVRVGQANTYDNSYTKNNAEALSTLQFRHRITTIGGDMTVDLTSKVGRNV